MSNANLPPVMGQPAQQAPVPKKSNTTLIVVLAIVLGGGFLCVILGAILFPVISQAKQAAVSGEAMAELKENATALLVYVAANDERFPPVMQEPEVLEAALKPYQTDTTLEIFPGDGEWASGNHQLNTLPMGALLFPSETPMLKFTSEKMPSYGLISYADSSARRLSREKFEVDFAAPVEIMEGEFKIEGGKSGQ
ncbi:MAG: hypothetical protein KDC26_12280 [Armatimonadetes bacterium]|nr:hypothetical protein [Armatimonadota bacterium]